MKSSFRRVGARVIGIAALALLPALGSTLTASADTQTVNYDIQSSAAGQTANSTLSVDVDTTAPATVAAGGSLSDVLAPGPITVPTSADGYTITQIQDITLKVPVPANSTYVSATLSGGSGLGSGTPTVSQSDGVVTVAVPGPVKGGATFTLPTLTLGLTAGTSGSIVTQLAGTSYSDPGLTFTAVVSVLGFPVDAATVGYPDPNPVLATTAIS
ncbi:MAG TPA: cyclase [Pseudonocardiaceae bacterium]|nr:cyclase [Pseudonocardiaceae bacterium]